jgi:hypothetical protein
MIMCVLKKERERERIRTTWIKKSLEKVKEQELEQLG